MSTNHQPSAQDVAVALEKAQRIIDARAESLRRAEARQLKEIADRRAADWAPYLEQIRAALPGAFRACVQAANAELREGLRSLACQSRLTPPLRGCVRFWHSPPLSPRVNGSKSKR